MGLTLWAYRVDLDVLLSLPGTADPGFAPLKERLAAGLADVDLRRENDKPSAERALMHLCDGTGRRTYVHGLVVEAICKSYGATLDNSFWEHFRVKFFSDLDDRLTERGLVGEDAWVAIVQSGIPVKGGRCKAPECGAMPPAQVERVGRLMDAMDLSKLEPDQQAGAAVWRGWLREAEAHGQGLVIFDY